ncbi:CHAT domain-containing protein [Candidatus Accumulibacter sp. ACC007]|uniref:CHAT domain-containing protein n=1 Tax=Candidatus Accumulibacter sp. ACC007 TaxID=2823333 RepID=UPI0025BEE1B2|nr:CHAT domain-containing protein [Candidatus Accumulibacter sp. ACC007]
MRKSPSTLNLTLELYAIGVDLYARIFLPDEDLRTKIRPRSLLESLIPLPAIAPLLTERDGLSKALWGLLFDAELPANHLARSLKIAFDFANEKSYGLRIRLRIMPTIEHLQPTYRQLCEIGILNMPAEVLEDIEENPLDWLMYLPWELVLKESYLREDYVFSLTRTLPQYDNDHPIKARDPKGILDVLLIAANPIELRNTGSDTSFAMIEEILQQAGNGAFSTARLERASPETLAKKLCEKEWDIVHILAHGTTQTEGDAGGMHAEDDEGLTMRVYGYQFRDIWKTRKSTPPQLVFLQVCDSAVAFGRLYRGLAQSIHAAGVPYVIGMQTPVSEISARAFTKDFYEQLVQLAEDETIDVALAHARRQSMSQEISARFIESHLANNHIVKYCPVEPGICFGAIPALYMRDEADGRLAVTSLPQAIRWPDGKVMLLMRVGRLDAFYIDKYPVTADQFGRFDEAWKSPFDSSEWRQRIGVIDAANRTISEGAEKTWSMALPNFPATGLTADQAKNYCAALGKQLPTEEEWRAAYTETYHGLNPDQNRHNCAKYWESGGNPQPTTVIQFKTQENDNFLQDLAGNCREIVLHGASPHTPHIIGGSFNNWFDLSTRLYSSRRVDLGFRCVVASKIYRSYLNVEDAAKRPRACGAEADDLSLS